MKIHRDIEQGGVDWSILRSGKVTASELDNLLTPKLAIRDGAMVNTYLHQKLAEKWIGGPLPSVQGVWDMEQGQILEEYARPAFTLETGIPVEKVGFIETDDGTLGCSPDGIIGTESGLEIKCPRMETHIGYLLAGKLPEAYAAQVHGSMFVTGFAQWYFCSFRRNFPPLIITVERDDEIQERIAEAVDGFRVKLAAGWNRLCELNGGEPQRKPLSSAKPQNWQSDPNDLIP